MSTDIAFAVIQNYEYVSIFEWSPDMVRLWLEEQLELAEHELLEFKDFDGHQLARCMSHAEEPLASKKLGKIFKKTIANLVKSLVAQVDVVMPLYSNSQNIPFINFEELQVKDVPLASGSFKSVWPLQAVMMCTK